MPERDFYRDTWVRYLGYANEVGESFRSMLSPRVVRGSYAVATAYCVADTVDKAWKQKKRGGTTAKVMTTAGDAMIWQLLASVAIPGYVINRLCYVTILTLKKRTALPCNTRKWITAFVGLASIPFIVHPIDNSVTFLMDHSYRKIFPS